MNYTVNVMSITNQMNEIYDLVQIDNSKIEIDQLYSEDFDRPIQKIHTVCTSVYMMNQEPIMITKAGKKQTNTKVFFNLSDAKHVLDRQSLLR